MKVDSNSLKDVLSGGVHFVLPHFQRQYTWELKNWKDLLDDVFRVYDRYSDTQVPEHFMGSLVVVNDGTASISIPVYKLVDGQQRLTTISLLLCALNRLVSDEKLGRRIQRFLVNEDEEGEIRYKLLPTHKNGDRDTYMRVIEGAVVEDETDKSPSVIDNAFRFLLRELRRRVSEGAEPERIFAVIANSLQVVFIRIDQQERPYAIFESLNAKGKPLTQTDLVRNYIAMKLPEADQEKLFNAYWAKIDDLLSEDRKVARIGELTAFLRHYLAFRSGTVYREDMIYVRFRDRMEQEFSTPEAFAMELKTLYKFAICYNHLIRPDSEPDKAIGDALKRLNILESTTAYPLLLAAYEAYGKSELSAAEFVRGIAVLENYLVRRLLVGDSGYVNRMFASLLNQPIRYSEYAESLKRILAKRRPVSDTRLRQELPNRPLYDRASPQRLVFILNEIERYLSQGSDGHVMLSGAATIEHILPQTPNEAWKSQLGEGLGEAQDNYLHTLGNLTLVTQKYNSGLSNKSFSDKLVELRKHAMRLNAEYFREFNGVWDANAIRTRADRLIDILLKVWPTLTSEEVESGVYIPPISVKGKKPLALQFLSERYPISYWKNIALKMCELAIQYGCDFSELIEVSTFFLSDSKPNTTALSNGYYLYTSISADDVLRICRFIGDEMDLEEGSDWLIEFTDYSTATI